jgi:hypothetical protein
VNSITATSIVGPALLVAYLGFGIYGIRLEHRAERFRTSVPPKRDRWNREYYADGAEPWLRKNRRWEQLRAPVWLGLPLLGWLLVRLLSG